MAQIAALYSPRATVTAEPGAPAERRCVPNRSGRTGLEQPDEQENQEHDAENTADPDIHGFPPFRNVVSSNLSLLTGRKTEAVRSPSAWIGLRRPGG